MKLTNLFLILLSFFFAFSVNADNDVLNYNQISLDASASSEVENDTMIVSLFVQEQGSQPSLLSDQVNKKINKALQLLKQHEAIKVETESYSTSPIYSKNQIISWKVRQSIRLESMDIPLMSEILGELQQQLKLSKISFDVSREKSEQETQRLIDKAISAYNKRATQIANQLKAGSYKIVNMNISTSSGAQPYRYKHATALMADAESVSAPEIAKGDKTLTVRVSGTIELE